MARRYTLIGGQGPYIHDDSESLSATNPYMPSRTRVGLATTGQIEVDLEPTKANHVTRNADNEKTGRRAFFLSHG